MNTNGNYIQNQFCNYKIALAIEELGFDEECLNWFNIKGNLVEHSTYYVNEENCYPKNSNFGHNGLVAAPLWQQVIDWIYKNYKILIYQYVNPDNIIFWVVKSNVEDFYTNKVDAFLKAIELVKSK